MTFHLHVNLLTASGIASNNQGESNNNIATLHKFKWKQRKPYTRISSEAIRWALRYYWQEMGYAVYRFWDSNAQNYIEQDSHDPDKYIDDDVMGYLKLEASKKEVNDRSESKNKTKKIPQKPIQRTGVLKVTSAVSLLPYLGDVTFNARAGEKDETSLYGSEYHATRYQYGFSLTPKRLDVIKLLCI
jgi:CRISPR-associated protein Cst2